ncbi:internal virion protein [Variovorax phage VAC_51]|uniref:Internal virion protein n=1 Tax=Variovorax phage VAC_51 TaxID=2985242 RepID=A0A9N6ZF69_9CAUD|nr:internal virion protein [Variovorax phage VAC_51]
MTFGLSAGAVAAIGVGVSAAGAMAQTAAANRAGAAGVSAGNIQSYKDYINSVNQTLEGNRAIGEANVINTIRTGYKVGLLNLQTAKLKERAAMEGWDVSRKATEALGNAEAMGAASGTIGSSVDAVSADIRKKSAEAQIAVDVNWYDTLENQNFQLNAITQAGMDAVQTVQAVPDINGVNTRTFNGTSVIGAGIIAGVSTYANNQFKLSTGK